MTDTDLRAAIEQVLALPYGAERWGELHDGCRFIEAATIVRILAAHPAPDAVEVRLTEAERVGIDQSLADSGCHGFIGDHADLYAAVERILAARLAEVAQPAGETRVEWGVKCDHGMSTGRLNEQAARSEVANAAGETCRPRVVSRTVTSFLDVVGEWEEVAGDE